LTCSIESFKRYVLNMFRKPFILDKHEKKNSGIVKELLDNDGKIKIWFQLHKFNFTIARDFFRTCDGSTARIMLKEDWKVSDLLKALKNCVEFKSEGNAEMDFTFLGKVYKDSDQSLRSIGMFRSLAPI